MKRACPGAAGSAGRTARIPSAQSASSSLFFFFFVVLPSFFSYSGSIREPGCKLHRHHTYMSKQPQNASPRAYSTHTLCRWNGFSNTQHNTQGTGTEWFLEGFRFSEPWKERNGRNLEGRVFGFSDKDWLGVIR